MRFRIKTPKLANHFFFISNLAAWHFSCRAEYNRVWLEQTGKLTSAERAALQDVRRVMQRYDFSYRRGQTQYLGRFFFMLPEREAWLQLRRQVTKTEHEHLSHAFEVFAPRFNAIWKRMDRNRKRLSVLRQTLRAKAARALLQDVERLFGVPRKSRTITVVVIFSPLDHTHTAAGGANVGPGFVTLEIPDLRPNTWQLAYSITVLGHEIAHDLWHESGGFDRLARTRKALRLPAKIRTLPLGTTSLINEAIIGSFIPVGALGSKHYQNHLGPLLSQNADVGLATLRALKQKRSLSSPNNLIRHLVWQLYPLALSYLRQRRAIDHNFIRAATELVRDLMK